ncbi:hypothetical protein D3C73_528150 [compost metagenome]
MRLELYGAGSDIMLLYWNWLSILYVSISMTTMLIVLTETNNLPFSMNTSAIVPVVPEYPGILISVLSPVTRSILMSLIVVPRPA